MLSAGRSLAAAATRLPSIHSLCRKSHVHLGTSLRVTDGAWSYFVTSRGFGAASRQMIEVIVLAGPRWLTFFCLSVLFGVYVLVLLLVQQEV